MKRLLAILIILISALSARSGETGLFTYEGGFFIKKGTNWTEYRPKDKPGVWATYIQYNDEKYYYNIKNDQCTLSIPKSSNNNFFKWVNGEWKVIYTTRTIYPSFTDSSVRLFCFTNGYYVRDGKNWRLYLPEKRSDSWADFEQYDEDEKFFYLRNSNDKVCVPKRSDLKCFLWNKDTGKWDSNYTMTEIYDHI